MQKNFIMALNAAAAFAAIDFKGVNVEPVYDTVNSQQTYSDDDFELTFNWGSAELKSGEKSAYVLAAAFQVGGVDVPDGTQISTTATIADPAAPGTTESWTCTVNWTKPDKGDIGAEGGIAKTATDATVAFTVTNAPNVAAWFGDDKESGVSYSSWYEYPAEASGEAEAEPAADAEAEAPAKNSWQMCSAARIVTSDVAGLDVVAGSGLEWKLGTAYTLSNSFSIAGGASIAGTDVEVTVSESGAMAKFAAAASVLMAMYAF